MPLCPRCGTKVTNPTKIWPMIGRVNEKGERLKLTLALFFCPECNNQFRKVIGKDKERITLKVMAKQIKGVEKELMQTLEKLREKIENLKNERSQLLKQIEELKKTGEEKVNSLEKEVSALREEVDTLKEMLEDIE